MKVSLMKWLFGSLFAGVLVAGPAFAQTYPSKPVKIIMPYQAGGSSDVMGRFYANALGKELGQAFVIDNRVGAGGNIGTAAAAKSPNDGYTLLVGTAATHALNQAMYSSVGFDAEKDFDPVGLLGRVTMAIGVNPASGIRTLAELISRSKAGKLNVGLPSTMASLVQELLARRGGSAMVSVPYKGSPAAINDLMGNHVQVIVDTAQALQPHINVGKIVPLGVTGLTHSELLPNVKTVEEQGMPGFEVTGWFMLFAPKGTPADIINKLNAAIKKVQANPETSKQLLAAGFDLATAGEPAQLSEFIRSEREKWGAIIKAAGIRAE